METRAKAFFKEANKKLNLAKEELFKPSENLLSYSVCKNSQFAIENYLKGFLIKNGVKLEKEETIENLMQKCIEVDKDFQKIDLTAISCKGSKIDSRYCAEIETVSACYDAADQIDTYLNKIKAI
ncbi:HEPN domain-containing protein [Lutibacter oricola]|uniref:HEPN domain-containing protein n=1 Tax=Lutibacter oricola TaxID=762486 RepID=A0A1H3ABK7_9FLAO|nr:HEPN domain-containing protein [Lutibacter oricola]SDX26239.1 HEPN domain-containing protein [Lutibacter oricola]